MHGSLISRLRAGFPAALALLMWDSAALAQGPHEHVATREAGTPSASRFEIRFLEGMIDHHAMAVHMSELLHAQAIHTELGSLGDTIAVAQRAEIEQMQAWLKQWYGRTHEPPTMMASMRPLERLKGEAFEKEFLQMMIRHHAAAVRQAKACKRRSKHTELRDMCHQIEQSQQREIVTMKDWLCRWYRKCA